MGDLPPLAEWELHPWPECLVFWMPDNVWVLSPAAHREKTSREAAERAGRCGAAADAVEAAVGLYRDALARLCPEVDAKAITSALVFVAA